MLTWVNWQIPALTDGERTSNLGEVQVLEEIWFRALLFWTGEMPPGRYKRQDYRVGALQTWPHRHRGPQAQAHGGTREGRNTGIGRLAVAFIPGQDCWAKRLLRAEGALGDTRVEDGVEADWTT